VRVMALAAPLGGLKSDGWTMANPQKVGGENTKGKALPRLANRFGRRKGALGGRLMVSAR
jgi:hypothetical protein